MRNTNRITYLKAFSIFQLEHLICATVDLVSGRAEARSYLTDWENVANCAHIHVYTADPYPVLMKWELESYNRQETQATHQQKDFINH